MRMRLVKLKGMVIVIVGIMMTLEVNSSDTYTIPRNVCYQLVAEVHIQAESFRNPFCDGDSRG